MSATSARPKLRVVDGGKRTAQPSATSVSVGVSRPDIEITAELHTNTDDAIVALRADNDLFKRDAKLVHVINVSREEAEKSPTVIVDGVSRHALVEGAPMIREMQPATLREHLSRYARFVVPITKNRVTKQKPVLPSLPIVGAVHARGEWPGIRPLDGIAEAPFVGPDGNVVQTPGYDASSRLLYVPSDQFPSIPVRPTRKRARGALVRLGGVFADFPFVDPSHAGVAVAAIMTILARSYIAGSVPGFLFDAATRGSGKSLLTDVIALVVSGRVMPRMNYPTDDTELEKVLAAYALQGAAFASLDNVTRRFGGGPIDRILTARGPVQLRVLGQSYVPTLAWLAVLFATGNNLVLCGDTARRVLLARLESPLENPEDRNDLANPDLLDFVRKNRVDLVVAALTILRAYVAAGSPNMGCRSWGSFEEWSRLIPHAIVWAGGPDVMSARPGRDADVDGDANALSVLLGEKGLRCLDRSAKGLTAKEILAALYPLDQRSQPRASTRHADLCEAIETMTQARPGIPPDAGTLGVRLRGFKGRVMGGRKLVGQAAAGGSNRWKVVDA